MQLRSVLPAMPVKKRNNLQNFKNADSKKQWIHFVNRKDWIATKHSVLCELHFVEIFTVRWKVTVADESCTHCLSPKRLSKQSTLPTHQTTCSLPRKRSFPDELSTFQQRDIISTFQGLNESVAQSGFQFKELDNCVIFPFSF